MIRICQLNELTECSFCLKKSLLEDNYFNDDEYKLSFIKEGVINNEIFVLDENSKIKGFIRVDFKGMLGKYPLLRLIAVNSQYRNKGIGKKLLNYYEEIGFKKEEKIFLLVSDFNINAKRLYEKIGYKGIGILSEVYKKEICEFVMMKEKKV